MLYDMSQENQRALVISRRACDKCEIKIWWPNEVLEIIIQKKMKNGLWDIQQKHPGKLHFDMEETYKESRWNTHWALWALKKYK